MKKINYSKIVILFIITFLIINKGESQVLINSAGGTPHGSSILEVRSTTQGLLIPRMTTVDREKINESSGGPSEGLLVFDTDKDAFFIFGNWKWTDLSMSAEIWSQSLSNVYLTNTANNVGIGTISPDGKLVIKADASKGPDDALFEIQDVNGETIFEVTSEGARLYVKDYKTTKGVSGGFAVGRYGTAKGLPGEVYLMVTPDSTRVYSTQTGVSGGFAVGRYGTAKGEDSIFFYTNVDNTKVTVYEDKAKGVSGGFAVGRYGTAKGEKDSLFFYTTIDSTRVYTDGRDSKGVSGGFAVGRYGTAKGGADTYMHMTTENYFIGHSAGLNTAPGTDPDGMYNLLFGYESGLNNTTGHHNTFVGHNSGYGGVNSSGQRNTFLGYEAGYSIISGADNVLLGFQSGYNLTTAGNNISIGSNAGFENKNNSDNIFLGRDAGRKHVGDGSVNSAINNIYIGLQAGYGDVSDGNQGNNNIFMGTQAGFSNETGENNIFIGTEAGYNNKGNPAGSNYGSNNIFLGNGAGYSNHAGERNIFIGIQAGRNSGPSGPGADNNIFIGDSTGYNNDTGHKNIFLGNKAGILNEIGVYNVLIGDQAGASIVGWMDGMYTRGSMNTFIGEAAGKSSTGYENTYIGAGCATYNVNGKFNVIMGRYANFWSEGGSKNVIIGYNAGNINNSTQDSIGDGNVFIGYYAGAYKEVSNQLFIDNSSTSTPLIHGDFSSNTLTVYNNLNVAGAYTFPTSDGSSNQVLTTDGGANVSWSTVGGTLVTAGNGLNFNEAPRVELGGSLNESTTITQGAYNMIFNLSGNGDFIVQDAGTSAFFVSSTGYTGIGTTSPNYKLDVETNHSSGYAARFFNDGNSSTRYGIIIQAGKDDGSQNPSDNIRFVEFRDGDGNYISRIYSSDGSMNYGSKSVKSDSKGLTKTKIDALSTLKNIQVVDYYPSENAKNTYIGFLGEEIANIFPDRVQYDEETKDYIIDRSILVPVLTKAIQEQQSQLEEQNNKIDKQNQKINNLEKQIQELKQLIQNK